jgi:quinol monooxygenase YgiN
MSRVDGQPPAASLQCPAPATVAEEGEPDVGQGYGTIYRMRPKPGAEAQVVAILDAWERDLKPKVPGAVGGYLFKSESRPGELIGVAVFRDRESYRANASNADQDAWYQRLRDQLEADPQWEDGVILGGFSEGGRL